MPVLGHLCHFEAAARASAIESKTDIISPKAGLPGMGWVGFQTETLLWPVALVIGPGLVISEPGE